MIEIKNIFKKYKNKNVVNDVSFNIEKGKITSFIGPNGAGKTTLISILTGGLNSDEGKIFGCECISVYVFSLHEK